MPFAQPFVTTLNGSFPYLDGAAFCPRLARKIQIPAWPQLPRRTFRENMYTQYSAGLPGIVIDDALRKVTFNTADDLSPALEEFYGRYLADDVDSFALPVDYAAGFYTMLNVLKSTAGEWAKGHVTGPISFGLTVVDQNLRSSLYDEQLADPIVKQMAFAIVWDIQAPLLRIAVWCLFAVGWLLVPVVSLLINHFDLFGTRQVWLHLKGHDYTPLPFRVPSFYKHVRHPLYIGWTIAFWATPTMTVGHLFFAGVLTVYMAVAAVFEERDLVAHFGRQYQDYRRRVPMFVPRLKPEVFGAAESDTRSETV